MSDFEDKHLRDEKGRFTSGAAGFVAKHTGKLEGYGGKGDPDAGRLSRDPSKETSPLAKWVASKHGIDLDLMRAAKETNKSASTGELKADELHRATDFVTKEIGRLTMQKEALVKEARKAEVSRVGYNSKLMSAKDAVERGGLEAEHYTRYVQTLERHAKGEPLMPDEQRRVPMFGSKVVPPNAKDYDNTPYEPYEPKKFLEQARERIQMEKDRAAAAQKLIPGLQKKVDAATAKRDAIHEKLGETLKQWRSANDALRVAETMKNEATLPWRYTGKEHPAGGDATAKDDKKDYSFNVSHDRQGNWDITAHGDTRSEGHEGEKSMVYRVDAGKAPQIISIDKKKNITFGNKELGTLRAMVGKELAPVHTMSLSFPDHKDGSQHPLDGETRGDDSGSGKDRPLIPNFFHEVDTSK